MGEQCDKKQSIMIPLMLKAIVFKESFTATVSEMLLHIFTIHVVFFPFAPRLILVADDILFFFAVGLSGTHYAKAQFERVGFFSVDPDSTSDRPVWNRAVSLKDGFKKAEAKEVERNMVWDERREKVEIDDCCKE